MLEGAREALRLRPRVVLAAHLHEAALPGDEADERQRPRRVLRLDQLDHLLHLVVQPGRVARAVRQPQDELVQKQDDAVVAELPRVTRQHRQPGVDVHERAALLGPGLEPRLHQRVEELGASLEDVRGGRLLEALAVPARGQVAPALARGGALVHVGEETLVAQAIEHPARVGEQPLVGEQRRDRRIRVMLLHPLHVRPEDRALDALLGDHVEVELKQLRLADEGVLGAERVQLGLPPRGLVAVEQQAQERHEMRLAAAEAAVEVRGLAAPVTERAADQAERAVERIDQRGRHDVGFGRLLRVLHALRQLDDEVALPDLVGQIEEVLHAGHRGPQRPRREAQLGRRDYTVCGRIGCDRMERREPSKCPDCGTGNVVRILRGEPTPEAEELARAKERGARVSVVREPRAAMEGADVVSTDVFASMGQESEQQKRLEAFRGFMLDRELLSRASKDVVVLHCLPAHRGEEIEEAVLEGPRSFVWDEAEARLHTSKAVLVWAMGLDG